MSENYILLAHDKSGFYFIHTIYDLDSYDSVNFSIDAQVYNCMISDKRISSVDQLCVVWTIHPDGKIYTTISSHNLSSKKIITKDEMIKKFKQCLYSQKKEHKLIFEYMYSKKQFDIYNVEINTTNQIWSSKNLIFADIVHYKTNKPL